MQPLLPNTNESFYELGWRLRRTFFEQLIEKGIDNIYDLLLRFDETEHSHFFSFEKAEVLEDHGDLKAGLYYTGQIHITQTGLPPNRIFSIEEINKPMLPVASLFQEGFDTIVELGCGYGRNLFILDQILNQPDVKYYGAEYTDSGRGVSEMLVSKMMPHMNFQSEFIDHKNPDFSFLDGSKKALIFSCHSIEQVAEIPDDYCERLANAVPEATVVHLEPFGFQTRPEDKETEEHYQFAIDKEYNLNLFDVLKKSAENNKINLISYDTDILYTQIENPTSIAVWNNKV